MSWPHRGKAKYGLVARFRAWLTVAIALRAFAEDFAVVSAILASVIAYFGQILHRIGAAPLLRIDKVRHQIALFPSPPCAQHVNHQVAGIDDIMRAYYFLRERNVRIEFWPGRHRDLLRDVPLFEGPNRMVYECSTGVCTIDDEAT